MQSVNVGNKSGHKQRRWSWYWQHHSSILYLVTMMMHLSNTTWHKTMWQLSPRPLPRDRGLKIKNVFLSKTAFSLNSNLSLRPAVWAGADRGFCSGSNGFQQHWSCTQWRFRHIWRRQRGALVRQVTLSAEPGRGFAPAGQSQWQGCLMKTLMMRSPHLLWLFMLCFASCI